MNLDTRVLLLFILLAGAALTWLIVRLIQVIVNARLRRVVTKETVMKYFCHGEVFDMKGMFRLFHLSMRPHRAHANHGSYSAYMGSHDKILLEMHCMGKMYYLDAVKSYHDYNWQFAGWYDNYDDHHDRSPKTFIVRGCYDNDEGKLKQKLPSFKLSQKAIEQLFEAVKVSAK